MLRFLVANPPVAIVPNAWHAASKAVIGAAPSNCPPQRSRNSTADMRTYTPHMSFAVEAMRGVNLSVCGPGASAR